MFQRFRNLFGRAAVRPARDPKALRSFLRFESLESRDVPSATAIFNTNTLTVNGDDFGNQITVAADTAGNLVVTDSGASVPILSISGTPIKANLTQVNVFGGGGDDIITLDRSLNTGVSGPTGFFAPNAILTGDAGNDVLDPNIGGFLGTVDANGVIQGTILGNVTMDGGAGDDFLDSGFGNDIMFGGTGNDTLQWLPGTLTDIYDGGAGLDNGVVVGNANNQGDTFVLGNDPNDPSKVLFRRTNLVQFSISLDNIETVTLRTQSGDDRITIGSLAGTDVLGVVIDAGDGNDVVNDTVSIALGGVASAVPLDITGGAGDDNLTGGNAGDAIRGGDGRDFIYGGRGNDLLDGGAGDDFLNNDNLNAVNAPTATGSDTLLGGTGNDNFFVYGNVAGSKIDAGEGTFDTVLFIQNGPSGNDNILITGTNDGSVLVQRTNGLTFAVPVSGIEIVRFDAGSGNDNLTARNLDGVKGLFRVDLFGSEGNDVIDASGVTVGTRLAGSQGSDLIIGGSGRDEITEPYSQVGDRDTVLGGAGDDLIQLGYNSIGTIYGGEGNDSIQGGIYNDLIYGGAGNDYIDGLSGNDSIYGETGNDILLGSQGADYLDGGDGNDFLDGSFIYLKDYWEGEFGEPLPVSFFFDGAQDTLVGGTGADTFVVYSGDVADLLIDFNPFDGDVKKVF